MGIKDEIEELRNEVEYGKLKEDTEKQKKELKFPGKWSGMMKKSTKKQNQDKVLVQYLTSNGQELPPMLLPLYSGNLIIYKDKVHEFDPRALWNVKFGKNMYKKIIIKESDRKPVSNLDWSAIKKRGDTTRNDEILLKMLRLAMIEKVKKQMGSMAFWIIGGLIVAGAAFYLFKGG
jgi:hypothetical protein